MSLFPQKEKVIELKDLPKPSGGAPIPVVLSDDHHLFLAYYVENIDPSWDGTTVKVVDPLKTISKVTIVSFNQYDSVNFGFPNDEVLRGHPLYSAGLKPWRVFEVMNSSWIQRLEKIESIHPSYRPGFFSKSRHFIFTFKDSIFECIAKSYSIDFINGTIQDAVLRMESKLRESR